MARKQLGSLYWNVNADPDDWTESCPDWLAGVDHWDRAQLAVPDDEYKLMSWQQVKGLVDSNNLQDFKRVPSDLRRYRRYIHDIKQSHGSVMNYILKERLAWTDTNPRGAPFEHQDTGRQAGLWLVAHRQYNDWPYGFDKAIVHLVVWVKFAFEEDAASGDLTPAARQRIDDYVSKAFRSRHDPEKAWQTSGIADVQSTWFKNWASLKSVHAIEHFHILLLDADEAFLDEVTDHDVPAYRRALGAA